MKMGLNERLLRKAVKELIKQGKPAKSSYGSCKYVLYENGKELNCLIGKLVPKQHRKYLLEGKCAKTTIELLTLKTKNRKYKPAIVKMDGKVAMLAQTVHDDYPDSSEVSWEEWLNSRILDPKSEVMIAARIADGTSIEGPINASVNPQ